MQPCVFHIVSFGKFYDKQKETYMKKIILFLLLVQFPQATVLSLKEVLASANNNALSRSLEQDRLQLEAKNQADTASEAVQLFTTGARAHPKNGLDDGNEYSGGFSKKLYLGDTQKQEQSITRLANEARLLEASKGVLDFENGLKNLYHQHCLDRRNLKSFEQNYADFALLYKKKKKAYAYQEIAKTELVQLGIEKNKLFSKLQAIKATQEISKLKLLMLTHTAAQKNTSLSCVDMYPLRGSVSLDNKSFELSKEAYHKRIQSTQVALKRHAKAIDSVTLSAQYDNEIDIERYTVGVSVPLAFSSKKSEQERAAALYKNAALSLQYEQALLEKKSEAEALRAELKNTAMQIDALNSTLNTYKNTLLPLLKKSYDLKESSVVEYLLNRHSYYQLQQELFVMQKAYYQTLFTLYALSEIKDKK